MDNVERKLVKNVHCLAFTNGLCNFDDCTNICSCRCGCRLCTLLQISVVFLDESLLMFLQFNIIIITKIYLISGKVENCFGFLGLYGGGSVLWIFG